MEYRKNEMLREAEDRGWKRIDWFREAGIKRHQGQDFLRDKSDNPRVAERLTWALGKRPGYYRTRGKRRGEAA